MMKYIDEFRDKDLVREIVRRIERLQAPATIMEVCGTHTMAAARFGLRSLLPEPVELISGPGCPVCVTDQVDIDAFLALGDEPDVVLTSFGDMLRVPGSRTSLERRRAQGAAVRVVYSPLDAVTLAAQEPAEHVIFFGVGFETTMPVIALAIRLAAEQHLENFSVLCVHKTMPAALRALLASGEVRVSGLLCPGHVTTIIGAEAYDFIPQEFRLPCAVTGFEPIDMLLGIEAILRQMHAGVARVDNVYTRAVQVHPNPKAQALLAEVFEPCDASWRGLGVIPGSGVKIRQPYARFDARARFPGVWEHLAPAPASPCRCGEVLRGVLRPKECPLFHKACTPSQPIGPCMVSSEGACAAAYKYDG
jgi:hydrogenase expression/formation protein HypD